MTLILSTLTFTSTPYLFQTTLFSFWSLILQVSQLDRLNVISYTSQARLFAVNVSRYRKLRV